MGEEVKMPAPPAIPQLPAISMPPGMNTIQLQAFIPGIPALPAIPALPGMEMFPPPPGVKIFNPEGKVIVAGPEIPKMPAIPTPPGMPAPVAPAEAAAPPPPKEKQAILEATKLEEEILAETEGEIEVPPGEREIEGEELVLESDEIDALGLPDEEGIVL